MGVAVTGGGFVSASSWGKLQNPLCISRGMSEIVLPDLKALSIKPPSRWGRFDLFARMGYVSAALTLQDAGYDSEINRICGMTLSSYYETINTDRLYYDTTLEEEGAFSSPNLFSYTLPVILIGECCSQFHLKGPAFCMGDDPNRKGFNGISTAIRCIESGMTDQMLVGSIEDPPAEIDEDPVSIFVFLESDNGKTDQDICILTLDHDCVMDENGRPFQSICDLFPSKES